MTTKTNSKELANIMEYLGLETIRELAYHIVNYKDFEVEISKLTSYTQKDILTNLKKQKNGRKH